ncbi:DNA repair-scaffolding protein isoform X12 [Homo sapiens]|nr:DNA repair-scaffolding protein isoform X12 [Homo sapiens]XP_054216188.1 DNA repair-scaffolding protein isoform X12 [Homo sapiens]|eukprot:XP_016868762.1 DNA repair-scaffolding protein isoform X6 [Homo sapiens]
MPRGSRARGSKRKRSWNTECPSFPGERPLQVRRAGLRTAGAAASLSEAWLRCGEGFQNTSGNPSLTAEEKTITEKHLELCPRPKQETTTSKSTSGLTDITWSSSGSDLSDEDKTLSQLQRDELQFIDWEIDSDRAEASDCDEFEDDEGAVEISDCASCASNQSLTSDEKLSELPKRWTSRKTKWTAESREICYFFVETSMYFLPKDTFRQKLIIPSGSCPVILNTYFCEKVVAKEDSEKTCEVYCPDIPLPRRSISLAQMFVIKGLTNNSPEIQVVCSGVATTGTAWTHGHKEAKQRIPTSTPLRDSLLDVVESQGAASWPGAGVRVVVQRVYSLPSRDSTRGQQGASSGHTDPAGTRACLLVQDACGMFGEVHLEFTMSKARQLEGKSCSLVGMKVLQKVTRGRTAGIFSLIDTLWPPAIPLKTPGRDQPCEEIKTHLPPPALCYILTAHPNLGQIDIIDEDPIYKLYQPPVTRCLRDILQMNDLGTRCSFYATVIYQKPQLKSLLLLEQREIWLLVTDVTLQTKEERDPRLPKTLLVYVAPLCVLGSEVLEALAGAAPHSLFFKDALRDQGRIVCAERTVLLLQKPLLSVVSGASSCELPGPVMLDSLDSATPVNSICSVQGTVVGVDESTAFSWPVCDMCGNGRLEQRPEDRGAFSCGDCSRVVTSPVLKRHLQVFLDCRSRPQCRVKVKVGARPEHARTPSSLQHSEELRSEECPRKGSGVVKLFCPVRNRPPDQLHWIGGNRASECRRGLCRTLAVAAGSVNFAMWLQGWWWWW